MVVERGLRAASRLPGGRHEDALRYGLGSLGRGWRAIHTDPLVRGRCVIDQGDRCATVYAQGREYRLRWIPAGDPRLAVMACNRDAALLDNGLGWNIRVASPETLVLVKRAHLYLTSGWHKHIEDYHGLLAHLPSPVCERRLKAAYEAMRERVIALVDAKRWTMRVSNEAFFSDFKYPYLRSFEHDDLHRATCYGVQPLYEQLKRNPSEAYIPRAAFERLSQEDKIRLAREEAYALGLERVLIPALEIGAICSEQRGFLHALRRLSTSLARGWFREFLIDYYPEIFPYDKPFRRDFLRAVETGQVRRRNFLMSAGERRPSLQAYWAGLEVKDREACMPFFDEHGQPDDNRHPRSMLLQQ